MQRNDLVPHRLLPPDVVREELERLEEAAKAFRKASVRENTYKAYERIWERFAHWCLVRDFAPLPVSPEVFSAYLTAAASEGIPSVPKEGRPARPGKPLNTKSLWVHLSAVAFVHSRHGYPNPIDLVPKDLLEGTLRDRETPPVKKRWFSQRQLNRAVAHFPSTRKGLRDRAILLVAFASGGRRRSEIAGLRFEDLRRFEDGSYLWTIPKTKTSDKPHVVNIPRLRGPVETCPARTLAEWISVGRITGGPVFGAIDRHGRLHFRCDREGRRLGVQPATVATLVKDAAERLGLDPDEFAGHSLRSGYATDMFQKGVRLETVMDAAGWSSFKTAKGYQQTAELLDPDSPTRRALERDLAEDEDR